MRVFETNVQQLKDSVLREVAALAWEDRLAAGILDIPEKIIPGPKATMRCCIYKERAVVSSRVKMAMGGDHTNPCVVEVMSVACDECPVTQMTVGPACRGCIATRCVHTCPKDAIHVVNHRAEIDHSKCILCGKCLNACPYGAIIKNLRPCERGCKVGAISMGEDRKASIDYSKCISCGTCTYQCPFGAIMDKSYIVDAIETLRGAQKWGYHVYAVLAPAIMGQIAPATLGQLVTGLRQVGFHAVREVALGADMTAQAEAGELLEKKVLTTSCCPAFVDYVEKNFPQIADRVSHTPSPMVMIGRHIKQQDPKAKVIFIGPCVAKKKEFQLGKTMGAIDCVLTFEELYPLLESRGIDITTLEEAPLDEASGYGRAFASSGGVAAAVAQALKELGVKPEDFQLNAAACSGIDACKAALFKMSKGIGDVNLIEGMACEGGCVQGAGILVRSPKNQAEVAKHVKEAGDKSIAAAVEAAE
ncbi:monomeric [FeFe] hydrogenase [Pseudoflavonifractor sp. HCP28S3_F10]|uniref:monomeric [FeFe] hydrogenase n=1 Tax=Pseudoflavonifractor sp. HCP28S3_F10 TaxID=3438947 RepID=UPI003F892B9B